MEKKYFVFYILKNVKSTIYKVGCRFAKFSREPTSFDDVVEDIDRMANKNIIILEVEDDVEAYKVTKVFNKQEFMRIYKISMLIK